METSVALRIARNCERTRIKSQQPDSLSNRLEGASQNWPFPHSATGGPLVSGSPTLACRLGPSPRSGCNTCRGSTRTAIDSCPMARLTRVIESTPSESPARMNQGQLATPAGLPHRKKGASTPTGHLPAASLPPAGSASRGSTQPVTRARIGPQAR